MHNHLKLSNRHKRNIFCQQGVDRFAPERMATTCTQAPGFVSAEVLRL